MTNRIAKIASAMLIGAIAGAFLAADAAPLYAADDCLSKPKGIAPQGNHWYYRVDRTTKRNCWYLAAEGRLIRSAKSSAAPPPPQQQKPLQPSVANARAEAAPADIALSSVAEPPRSGPTANTQDQNPRAADTAQGAVASRWLDQASSETTRTRTPQTNDSVAGLTSPTDSPSIAAAPVAALPLASADTRSIAAHTTVPKLFLVIVGALAIAAIFGAIIFRFGSRTRNDRRGFRGDERAPWASFDVGATIGSPPLATPAPTSGFARAYSEPAIPDEIVQLLTKLSKEAPA